MDRQPGRMFLTIIATFVTAFLALYLLFPPIARMIVDSDVNLPVPGTLFLWYMVLITLFIAIYVISSKSDLADFLEPVIAAVRGKQGIHSVCYRSVCVALPLLIGFAVFDSFVPKVVVSASTRQQHPGMSHPGAAAYAGMDNPYRDPTAEMLAEFRARYEQHQEHQEELADALPKKLDVAKLSDEELRQLYFDQAVVEGRQLYQKNCRPCHGTGHDGAGPMARTFQLKPVAFNDPGTIATLVEGSVFWRVSEGGIGLPRVATPWDSPMPKWKDELSEEQRWKVIMSIYHDIGMKPRVLEMAVEE